MAETAEEKTPEPTANVSFHEMEIDRRIIEVQTDLVIEGAPVSEKFSTVRHDFRLLEI